MNKGVKMRSILFILSLALLTGCADVSTIVTENDPGMPTSKLSTDFVNKDYNVVGRVRGEYTKTCFLFNLVCSNNIFIADDLISKAKNMGADEVIDMVIDKQTSSWLWAFLFTHQSYRANGLAVKLVPAKK